MRVAVIGGGIMGLSAAVELLKQGHEVTVYEEGDRVGGMSASFDFGKLKIERFYHFICGPDRPLIDLLEELKLSEKLRWRETHMGYFLHGTLLDWGNPWALLKFPALDPVSRIRCGLHAFAAVRRSDGQHLDRVKASDWLLRGIGKRAYDVLWKKLFELKFHQYADDLSAAWIWSRIRRVGRSRENAFVERLGYLEGGTETLLKGLRERIASGRGSVRLSTPVKEVRVEAGAIRGVCTQKGFIPHDLVVSTVPLPYVAKLVPGLQEGSRQKYLSIQNLAVVCTVVKTGRPLSRNFWMNINDSRIETPGLIEFTNLNPLGEYISYLPFYLPHDHPYYSESEAFFERKTEKTLALIRPDTHVLDMAVQRYDFAQPICTPGFFAKTPPIRTEIDGLYIADTTHGYPEDRSVSESIRLGKEMAGMVHLDHGRRGQWN